MPEVAALYRHPVKGMAPQPHERLTVLDAGPVAGDRVLGLLFADAGDPDFGEWWHPKKMLTLTNTPGLALIGASLDAGGTRLEVTLSGKRLVEAALDEAGRGQIAAAVGEYIATLPENPLRDHPERAPLQLVGDTAAPALADHTSRHISVIGRASIEALAMAMDAEVDERRFRGNVLVEGIDAWDEFNWVGRTLRIGDMEFEVAQPIVRCLATHANPESGDRDLAVMNTLTSVFGHEQPLMGVLAVPAAGGEIAVGDAVTIEGQAAS
ncbi:MAG TPA: MOSC domain-containing protein [Dehalococcoidia bacterium]|nr:MOSC domain-containing protein [Dehalococcoidia bacterium]